MGFLQGVLGFLAMWGLPLLFAITWREAIRAHVAKRLGDPAAVMLGRGSFNPMRHFDPVGTLLVPLALFLYAGLPYGYAKPLPSEPRNIKHPLKHWLLMMASSVGASLALALIGALLLLPIAIFPDFLSFWMAPLFKNFVLANCVILIFNLLPLPPLDGGKLLAVLLPRRMGQKFMSIEPFGILILVGILIILPMAGNVVGAQLRFGQLLVLTPAVMLYNAIMGLFGISL